VPRVVGKHFANAVAYHLFITKIIILLGVILADLKAPSPALALAVNQ